MSDRRDDPSGVLIIDKPEGPTSHDVVARVRRAVRSRQVGHAGTLDPMATGVLVVAIGDATKLVPWLTAADKQYETTIRLGIETDTLDAQGTVTRRAPLPDALRRDPRATIAASLQRERAREMQSPPAYSAIRIDGERAHDLARSGRLDADAELPARAISVRELDLVALSAPSDDGTLDLKVRVTASKGYFVRSLARDLARELGTVGHLTALRRLRSGAFDMAQAVALSDLSTARDHLLSVTEAATRALPVSVLDAEGERAARFGQRVTPPHLQNSHGEPSAWVILTEGGAELVAIGQCDADGVGRVLRGFSKPR